MWMSFIYYMHYLYKFFIYGFTNSRIESYDKKLKKGPLEILYIIRIIHLLHWFFLIGKTKSPNSPNKKKIHLIFPEQWIIVQFYGKNFVLGWPLIRELLANGFPMGIYFSLRIHYR